MKPQIGLRWQFGGSEVGSLVTADRQYSRSKPPVISEDAHADDKEGVAWLDSHEEDTWVNALSAAGCASDSNVAASSLDLLLGDADTEVMNAAAQAVLHGK